MDQMLSFLLIFLPCALGQTATNVILLDHVNYFVSVLQETMNEVEKQQWCNLKVEDFSDNIDSTIMGWSVKGVAHYRNGFVTSLKNQDITTSTIQHQIMAAYTTVYGVLNLRNIGIGWDVEFVNSNGSDPFYTTGVFVYELISLHVTVNKNMTDFSITTALRVNSVSGAGSGANVRRISFLPANQLTEILSRTFSSATLFTMMDAASSWINDYFSPILTDVVKNRIAYPTVCYNCAR